MHNPSNNNCPRNADPRNESCACDMQEPYSHLKVPTVHLNGTSKDALLEQVLDARQAILDAIKKLAEAAPNARDYYVQPSGSYPVAQDQHWTRLGKLHEVVIELDYLAEEIDKQGRRN